MKLTEKIGKTSFGVKLASMGASAFTLAVVAHSSAFAAQQNMLDKTGIKPTDLTGDGAGSFFSSMKNIVYMIMGLGGLWCVAWIAIAGMLLGGSGSNPQRRNAGIAAIATAAVGVFVVYKSYDIAGWAVNIGTTK